MRNIAVDKAIIITVIRRTEMTLKCGHCGGTNLGDNVGIWTYKFYCADCGALTRYDDDFNVKWTKGGKGKKGVNIKLKTENLSLMSRDELERQIRLGEKFTESTMKNISKIDWWTGGGSGRI